MTLRELKNMLPATRGQKAPTAKYLRESDLLIVTEISFDDFRIVVYQNGFALYQAGRDATVFPVDRCDDYRYFFADGEKAIGKDYFLNQEYYVLLFLIGEDRLTHNRNAANENHEWSYSREEGDWDEEDPAQDILSSICLQETMDEMFGLLTERQLQILKLYYLERLTTREIAASLGITHQTVSCSLKTSKKLLEKNCGNF